MHSLAYIFLQLMLTAVAYAAPIEASGGSLDTYAPGVGGVLGFIVLVLDILVFSALPPSNPLPAYRANSSQLRSSSPTALPCTSWPGAWLSSSSPLAA
jgi:hypothetical protein